MEDKYKNKFKIQKKELKDSVVQPLQVYLMRNPRNIKAITNTFDSSETMRQEALNTQLNSAMKNNENKIEVNNQAG